MPGRLRSGGSAAWAALRQYDAVTTADFSTAFSGRTIVAQKRGGRIRSCIWAAGVLAGVSFLDCAGINVLLATRRRARLEGGWLRVVHPSAAAWRVISLLGLQDVLTAEQGAGERRA